MKIGVLAHYLDTRMDLRDLLDLLGHEHDIVAYIQESEAQKIGRLLPDITVVPIPVFSGISRFFQLIWQYTYLLFGRLPASSNNYYLTEHIKLLNSSYRKWSKLIQASLLSLSKVSPKIISYDQYLDGLSWLKMQFEFETDIDVFVCFTEISNDWIFAKLIQENKPVWTYVYSWDHPCKMKTFSKRTNYLVWNEGIKEDLITLQQIESEKIQVLGATQFASIEQFLNAGKTGIENSPYNFPYIYLGFATGYDALARQEVKYCHQVTDILKATLPDWKLVIRPYPFQKNITIYKLLTTLPNVIFDDSISSNDKFLTIKNASAFLHFGTTMGYEAMYFDTPSFLLAIADQKKDALLHGFVHQYQNDKYLNTTDSLVIKSYNELIAVFENLARGQLEVYSNQKNQLATPLHSLPVLAERLISIIKHQQYQLISPMKLIASPLLPMISAPTISGRISLRILNEVRNVFRRQLRQEMISRLPIYEVDEDQSEIHMLICKRDFEMAIITAAQLNHLGQTGHSFTFHDDGTLDDKMEETIYHHFPGTLVVRRNVADFIASQKLFAYPNILEFRKKHVMALKLIDTAIWAQNDRIGYLDSDVLFFRYPEKYIQSLETGTNTNYFNQDMADAYISSSSAIKREIGFSPAPRINAGLWTMNKKDIDLYQIELWLKHPFFHKHQADYRLEQTFMALLAQISKTHTAYFPKEYDVSFEKIPKESVCKHYVGRIRYGYELEGIKYLINDESL
ncbi:hypothetical protein [Dyadobacter frigoris]|uniref:Nucleotide-diphospho-sugar transferase domain-containing protein n=1 Tax=Dyadobacter frigoris TaxID=2576211 RepID=A0A4U6D9G9_9BACT|nr:hypothetical protein [Dyadobacter frigoris]TKT94129.1 hypothetical protein FDK13_02645 [Dyadobacter frigoris]GLU50660.1 hypothetical protein Dfri01_01210 [Dyadobacter frigoris]